jgi:hypothetical protein
LLRNDLACLGEMTAGKRQQLLKSLAVHDRENRPLWPPEPQEGKPLDTRIVPAAPTGLTAPEAKLTFP